MAVPSASPWTLRSQLPWPAARGASLWSQFASVGGGAGDKDANCAPHGFAHYDVELYEPSTGHIALVLARKPASSAGTGAPVASPAKNGATVAASPLKARRDSALRANAPVHTATATAISPRVVFVVDAIPPRWKATSSAPRLQQRGRSSPSLHSLSPVSVSSTISSSNGTLASEATATNASVTTATTTAIHSGLLQAQDVDEMELIDELFAVPKVGKEGCIVAKAPILCARFDCKVVAIKFMRGHSHTPPSSSQRTLSQHRASNDNLTTLRCVVALEDGMAYLWEWGADLHQWTFLNSFCFLENPNLKWTKPVAAFTATDMAWYGETTEFAWWSLESKQEPKLCLRKIQYEQETNTFRTEITIGNPFSLQCADVTDLKSSKLGLWIVTKSSGVHFRSASSLCTLSLNWRTVLGGGHDSESAADAAAVNDPATQLLVWLHNVTGELLVLVRATGVVHLVTPNGQAQGLRSKQLTTLSPWSSTLGDGVLHMVGHRHLIFALTHEKLLAFSYLTGEKLASIALPGDPHPNMKLQLWTIAGAASAVGLWSSNGFWFIHTPSAKDIGRANNAATGITNITNSGVVEPTNPKAAFESLTGYGESVKFDSALYALEILEKAATSLDSCDQKAWQRAYQAISSPALLLAIVADQNAPDQLLDELSRLVTAVYQAAHDIMVTGRFTPSPLDLASSSRKAASGDNVEAAQRLTPANIEALHHLSNWVLLAKRKITRLQTSVYFKGRHHLRPRAVSALTTAPDNFGRVSSQFSPLEASDPNFRLSRKLRPMSSLRFASGSSSLRHGQQWLAQLESFLLDGVAFKQAHEKPTPNPINADNDSEGPASSIVPSHLLFHEERRLEDYRSSNSSFSKHMYLESMSRLYLLHEPESLLAFVSCVAQYCPRMFSLSGVKQVSRTHAERALTLFPPMQFFIDKLEHERRHWKQLQGVNSSSAAGHGQSEKVKKQQRQAEIRLALAKDSVLAYADLLCRCCDFLEATRALLECDLYEQCKEKLLVHPPSFEGIDTEKKETTMQQKREQEAQQQAVSGAVYFSLLEYCVQHRDVEELQSLLTLKPAHVSALHVLRALRSYLPQQPKAATTTTVSPHFTVGKLRLVLLALLKQQRAEAAA
uniref:Uncharacterized protein n=1 Tax=Globisporangium ultimum (strain ATCC 200006 / CBS 805.95 / DAOM BR144) TaxID=431595 RepID=K3WUC6_GLOUD